MVFSQHLVTIFSTVNILLMVDGVLKTPPKVTLNDGNSVPTVELGTYGQVFLQTEDQVQKAMKLMIERSAYRYIDVSSPQQDRYREYWERAIGLGIYNVTHGNKITREELYITAQVRPYIHSDYIITDLENKTLTNLNLTYVDFYILPLKWGDLNRTVEQDGDDYVRAWREMEECKGKGIAKSIGIGYFNDEQLKDLLSSSAVKPAIHLTDLPSAKSSEGTRATLLDPHGRVTVTCPMEPPIHFSPVGTYGRNFLFLDYDYKNMYRAMFDWMLMYGVRYFDTSSELDFEVERLIGERIKKFYVPKIAGRGNFRILTRLWNTHYKQEQVLPALKEALQRLQMSYVDYYIINSPGRIDADGSKDRDYIETWKGMLEVQNLSLAKHIGLANFEPEHLQRMSEAFENFDPCILKNPVGRDWVKKTEELFEKHRKDDIKIMTYTKMSSMVGSNFTEYVVPIILNNVNQTYWNKNWFIAIKNTIKKIFGFYDQQDLHPEKYDREYAWLMTAFKPGFVVNIQ